MSFLPHRELNVSPVGSQPLLAAAALQLVAPLSGTLAVVEDSRRFTAQPSPLGSGPLNLSAVGEWLGETAEFAGHLAFHQLQRMEPLEARCAQIASRLSFRVLYDGNLYMTLHHGDFSTRISTQTQNQGRYLWRGKISRLSPIRIGAQGDGGFVKLSWGQLGLLPDTFTDDTGALLTPPKRLHLVAHWGVSDQVIDERTLAFEGDAVLRGRSEEEVLYEVLEPAWEANALELGCASGAAWGIEQLSEGTGANLRLDTIEPHRLAEGDEVFLQATDAGANFGYGGLYDVLAVAEDSTWLEVNGTFEAALGGAGLVSAQIGHRPLAVGQVEHMEVLRTGFEESQTYYRPNLGQDLRLFDEGVEITEYFSGAPGDVLMQWNGVGPGPSGRVTASGTAHWPEDSSRPLSTLAELFEWAAQRLGLTFHNPDGAALSLDFVQTEPIQLIDLLDQVAGYAGYLFYIQSGQLSLIDPQEAHGSIEQLSPIKVEQLDYQNELPLKELRAQWECWRPASEAGVPVIRERTETLVVAGPDPQGERRNAKVFNSRRGLVKQRMQARIEQLERPLVRLSGPMDRLSNIGEQFTMTDEALDPPWTIQGQVESMELDFIQDLLVFTGKVEVS